MNEKPDDTPPHENPDDPNSEPLGISIPAKDEINKLHKANLQAAIDSVERAIRIGELLTAERPKHEHGTWLPWFTQNIHFSLDTYDNYKRVYENRVAVRLSNVESIRDALKLINDANRKKKEPKAKQSTPIVTAPPIETTVEPDDKAPLRTEAVAALKSLNISHASDWVAEATGDTTEEIIKDALRLREGTRDPSQNRLILDVPAIQVTEVKPELPLALRELLEPPLELTLEEQPAPQPVYPTEGWIDLAHNQFCTVRGLVVRAPAPLAKRPVGRPKKVQS